MWIRTAVLAALYDIGTRLRQRSADVVRTGRDRGDVPGWVMVVVMTAALVLAILIPFREAIVEAIQNALQSVTGASSG